MSNIKTDLKRIILTNIFVLKLKRICNIKKSPKKKGYKKFLSDEEQRYTSIITAREFCIAGDKYSR